MLNKGKEKGLSTVDLLMKVVCFVKEKIIMFSIPIAAYLD